MKALQVITPRSFTCVETLVADLKTLAPDRILVKTQWVFFPKDLDFDGME